MFIIFYSGECLCVCVCARAPCANVCVLNGMHKYMYLCYVHVVLSCMCDLSWCRSKASIYMYTNKKDD